MRGGFRSRPFRAALALGLVLTSLAPIPAAAQGRGADRAFMIGRWTDTSDCADAVFLNRDGSFTTETGAGGYWHIENGRLSLTGSSTVVIEVAPLSRDRVRVVNADGSVGGSSRCPGGDSGRGMPSVPLTRNYLIGYWVDGADCSSGADSVTLNRNGTFVTPQGGNGDWVLSGDVLTLRGGGGAIPLRIVPIDPDIMIVVNTDGSIGRSIRC